MLVVDNIKDTLTAARCLTPNMTICLDNGVTFEEGRLYPVMAGALTDSQQ
jgi:hypothetical protein